MDGDGFSGVVKLTNVSDFIAPNLNCIIPLEKNTFTEKKEEQVTIRKKNTGVGKLKEATRDAIKVSLSDCLACNGCITSAETVLVEEQSLTRLLELLAGKHLSVVSVSPQSVCSIAAKRRITVAQAAALIASYFFQKGVRYVVDSSFGRSFALDAAWEEMCSYLSSSEKSGPMLSSACPGFVCFAEKSNDKNILLPRISTVRSPQAINAGIVKDYLARKLGINPTDVVHATVMPCFDKKLEASRPQLTIQETEVRETDCVISTAELDSVLGEVTTLIPSTSDGWLGDFARGNLIGSMGGTSGGYAENILRRYLAQNPGCSTEAKKIRHMYAQAKLWLTLYRTARSKNMDVVEVSNGQSVVLRVARVYGFRNIQYLLRKWKTGKCNYDYAEVMACPSGCGNGGGQIRYETMDERASNLAQVEQLYGEIQNENSDYRQVALEWASLNNDWKRLLFTDYKAVETNIMQTLQW